MQREYRRRCRRRHYHPDLPDSTPVAVVGIPAAGSTSAGPAAVESRSILAAEDRSPEEDIRLGCSSHARHRGEENRGDRGRRHGWGEDMTEEGRPKFLTLVANICRGTEVSTRTGLPYDILNVRRLVEGDAERLGRYGELHGISWSVAGE